MWRTRPDWMMLVGSGEPLHLSLRRAPVRSDLTTSQRYGALTPAERALRRSVINHRSDSHSRGKWTRRSIRRGGYRVRRVVTITVATKSSKTSDTGAQRARSAVLLVMILRTTATAE